MFKYFLISIVVAPILFGVAAARGRNVARDRKNVKIAWVVYGILWFCTLYYLRIRWS